MPDRRPHSATISDRERAVVSSSGATRISMEKLGYQYEQTDDIFTVILQVLDPDGQGSRINVEQCDFTASSVHLRVTDEVHGHHYFFDCSAFWATCDPLASRVRLPRKRGTSLNRVCLDIAKAERGHEWPRLRDTSASYPRAGR
jgi:hypothetical protein